MNLVWFLKLKYKKIKRGSLDNVFTSKFDDRSIHSNLLANEVTRVILNVKFAILRTCKTEAMHCPYTVYSYRTRCFC